MPKIAVDIVLLPDAQMSQTAIARNKQLITKHPGKVALDPVACLPHISLCMGIIEKADTPKVTDILRSISQSYQPLRLIAESIKVAHPLPNEQFSMYDVTKTSELQALFEAVMTELRPYLSYDHVAADMFVNPPEVEDISYTWVKGYGKKHDNLNAFHPHLSLGVGDAGLLDQPIAFTAPTLALCQLGNYCTCRKVLADFSFPNS